MTLTLVGDVFLGGFLTLIADRSGRRKVLIGGSLLMVMSGTVFAFVENFWILLIAAVLGVISTTGGDFGPFRSIEESVQIRSFVEEFKYANSRRRSILSHLTTPKTRADVLAWYVTTSTFGSAIGSEMSGRIIHALQEKGWSLADAYHVLFLSYTAMGVINAGLSFMLTDQCEMYKTGDTYSQVPQDDVDDVEQPHESIVSSTKPTPATESKRSWYKRFWTNMAGRLSQISAPTRKVMYKLWFLLAVDSLADGMVPYSLTNYYMEQKFDPAKSTLGDINGIAYLLGAFSTVFAGPLSRKIGLINTMVFTHIPSSAAVLIFPLPPYFWLTVILLFIRAGLNNLDQAPRSAFIAAVVKPDERTAAMGVTAIVRTLAATTGPTVTGILAESDRFWIAFVAAGACRLVYDIGLYALFVNMELHQHEGGADAGQISTASPRTSDEEEMTEMESLNQRSDTDAPESKGQTPENPLPNRDVPTLMPVPDPRVRRRSPSPLPKSIHEPS